MTQNDTIANSISSIRLITRSIDLNQKKDRDIFLSFKKLSKFVFENFDMPASQYDYIINSFKNRNAVFNGSIENFIALFGNQYNIELPLRAVEVIFSYAENDNRMQDDHKLIRLKYLIAKLHYHVGKRYFELVDENISYLN